MQEQRDTVRLEAFSDGVFAIAMTLLVIALKVPSHELVGTIGLAQSLIDLWPSYLAFVTSFATVLVIWVHHHWVFALIDKSDHSFLYWNGLLMLFVTLGGWGLGTAIRALVPGTGPTKFVFECTLWLVVVALLASPLANRALRDRLSAAIPR